MSNDNTAKPTPGLARIHESGHWAARPGIEVGNFSVVVFGTNSDDAGVYGPRANADLICEAFNVHTETGLTPRQLAEQRDELLECLRGLLSIRDSVTMGQEREQADRWWPIARAIIAKVEAKL